MVLVVVVQAVVDIPGGLQLSWDSEVDLQESKGKVFALQSDEDSLCAVTPPLC